MAKPRPNKKTNHPSAPLVAVLNQLVVPVFEEEVHPASERTPFKLEEAESDTASAANTPCVHGLLRNEHLMHVCALPLDSERTTLRMSLLSGYLLTNCPQDVLLIGNLLDRTPFHVRTDIQLARVGSLAVGCDLVVRADDAPLVRHRLRELLQLANDLLWYFPLHLPHHLGWHEVLDLEIDWVDLPHDNLGEFLDEGLTAPPSERTPLTLLRIAQGLARWQDVLKLLRDHPNALPLSEFAPLKCMAHRQLCRWLPAIRAAKAGGIRNGRYPGVQKISPSFVHSLIAGGDEIEALRILGKPDKSEPAYYQWLRGLAFHRAGDFKQATSSFKTYFATWPGDIISSAIVESLTNDQ